MMFITLLLSQIMALAAASEPATQPAATRMAASQPTVAIEAHCDKHQDAAGVTLDAENNRIIVDITSPGGIGGATLECRGNSNGNARPNQLVLRLHLHGLESLNISCGDVKLSASVSSQSGNAKTLRFSRNNEEDAQIIDKSNPLWMDIRLMDSHGQPAVGLPGAGGYFEMDVPQALLDGNAGKVRLEWVDFYR